MKYLCLSTIVALLGCASRVVLRSEFIPKYADAPISQKESFEKIIITKSDVIRPHDELGELVVSAFYSRGDHWDEIANAIIEKAKEIGADAIIRLKIATALTSTDTSATPQYRDPWGHIQGGVVDTINYYKTEWHGTAVRWK